MTQEEENGHLQQQLSEALERLSAVMKELSKLEEETGQQREQMSTLLVENQALKEQLAAAHHRIEELEKQKTPPPAFVKANQAKGQEKKARKKRAAQHNHGRRRETPTRSVEHPIRQCPVCGDGLGGVSVARRRQVIELPPAPRVEVTEHVVYHGWCSRCGAWREAPLDVSGEVVGQGRLGVRVASVIAYLRTVLRLPVRQIQAYLLTLHGLKISVGEMVELLHRVRKRLAGQVAEVKAQIRASPAVQMDETSWREDGSNGYIWEAATPQLRYYEYHHSRGSEVVKQILGEHYEGVVSSDFYAAYNIHEGLHQRCWVHFVRDVHDLKERFPDDAALHQWSQAVKDLIERAEADAGPEASLPPTHQEAARRAQQQVYEQALWQLCAPYVRTSAPMHTLCERVERFLPELFVFVAVPGVPSHNNLAERSLRPLVIARKISGGSRSPAGSDTRMALFSLFGTWAAQGLNPFFQCLAVLSLPNPLGQV